MKNLFDKQNKYGIRKLSVGVCSAVIGLSFLASATVEADQHEAALQPVATEVPVVEAESEAEELVSVQAERSASPSVTSAEEGPVEALSQPEVSSRDAENDDTSLSTETALLTDVASGAEAVSTSPVPAASPAGSTVMASEAQPAAVSLPTPVTEITNQTLATGSGNKVVLDETVKNHLKTADSGTIYLEYRAPQNATLMNGLFSASSSTNGNQYTVIYTKNGKVGAEIRSTQTIDLSEGTQPVKFNEWNAVAMTYQKNTATNQTRVSLYVNGVLSQTKDIAQDVFKPITDLNHAQLGAAQRAANSVWGINGMEFRNFSLYREALTPAQVEARSALFKRQAYELPKNPGEVVSDQVTVFQGGRNNQKHEGVFSYRIPALLVTDKGTVIAATDQRQTTFNDWGDIATVIRRSTDNGKTWSGITKLVDLRNNPNPENPQLQPMTIDTALVQDPTTKRIYAFYDMVPEMQGAFGLTLNKVPSYSQIDGKAYLNVYKENEAAPYTVRENGVVYTPEGQATDYRVNVNDSSEHYANLGDVYKGNDVIGNIYHQSNVTSPFKIPKNMYIWMSYSDDDGVTWSRPKDMTASIKKDYMNFFGVGPGAAIALHTGPHKGRLIVPAYLTNFTGTHPLYNGSMSTLTFYSDDHGETWKTGESVNDNRTLSNGTVIHSSTMGNSREQTTEASIVQLNNGDLKIFMRGTVGKVLMATSKDGGATWTDELIKLDDVTDVGVQLSAIQFTRDGKEYVVLANAEGPGRYNGHVRLAEVDAQGNLKWINHRLIRDGKFAYNSIQKLSNGDFGLLYENSESGENEYSLRYKTFNWTFLTSPEPKLPDINVSRVDFEGNDLAVLTFEDTVLPTNNPSLLLTNGNRAQFVEQREPNKLVYRIQPNDKGQTVLEVASGDISNINGPKVNIVTKLGDGSNLTKIDSKTLRATAGNADAWQPGAGPDKLLDGNKSTLAELKWDTTANRVNGVYPEAWRLPQSVTISPRDGQPMDLTALLVTKRVNENGTMTKYKVEAFNGTQKVHDSGDLAVAYDQAEVIHQFNQGITADRLVLTVLEAKKTATGEPTPTMLTLKEVALFGSRSSQPETPTDNTPRDEEGGGTGNDAGGTDTTLQTPPAQPTIIKQLENQTLTTQNGTKIVLGDDVKDHLRTANSGTVYVEYRAPQNAPGFHSLFNASSGTVDNHYTAIYSKDGHIGMESRTTSGYNDFNTGTERVKNGEWNAVAMTYEKNPETNQTTVKLYVNGVHSLTQTGGNDLFASMTNLTHAQLGAAQRASRGAVWGANGLEFRNFTLYGDALPEETVLERSAQFKRKAYTLPTNPGEEVSEKIAVFQAGRNGGKNAEGVGHYRIPALLVTDKGTVLAVGDQRRNHAADWGDIAIVVRRSSDQGDTWGNTIKIIDLKQNPNAPDKSQDNVLAIDSALVQDPVSKRIFAFYDMYPEGAALFGMPATREGNVEYTTVNGKKYLNLYKTGEATPYTVRENGRVFTPDGVETNYRVDIDGGGFANSYADLGDLYEGDRKIDNIFFQTAKGSPFRAPNNSFMWMSYSDDDGVTWSQPRDLTPDLKADYMKFLGTGPGTGIVLRTGEHAGRLIVPAYATNWTGNLNAQSSLVFYSDDKGETWHAGESVNDNRRLANGTTLHLRDMNNLSEIKTEATVVQLNNGELKMFMRGQKGKVTMATSKNGGETWENDIVQFDDVNEVYVQLSAIHYERDGKEYVILANAEGPGRTNGHVRVAEVDAEGNLNWINHRLIQDGNFAYNSIQHLGGDDFALLYEHNGAGENTYSLYYKKFNWTFLTSPEPKLPDINVANVTIEGDNLAVITFEDSVLPTNNPSLLLSNGNTAQFVEQRNANTLVYRIQPGDKDKTVLEVASGDISNVNGPKVNVVTKLNGDSNLTKIDNKTLRVTAGNADAWQPGAGPDKLLDGNKTNNAELKWDMPSNYDPATNAYPVAWRLPQSVTVSTRDGQPIDLTSMLITKRTPGNGTMTKYKVEAYNGDQKVHDSGEVAVDFAKAEVAHEFNSPIKADRVVLTVLEAKQNAAGEPTPTMMTLREIALFGPRSSSSDTETDNQNGDGTGTNTGGNDTGNTGNNGGNDTGNTGNTGNTGGTGNTGQTTPTTPVKRERKEIVSIPFAIEFLTDPNLPIGQIREEGGRNGSVDRIYEDTYLGDVRTAIGTQIIREENHVAPVKKVIYVGAQSTGTTTTPTTPTPTATTRRVTETVQVQFDTLTYNDPSLPSGSQETVREGVNGSMIKVYEETVVNGQVVSRRLVDINSVVPATAKLVRRGTGSAPTTPTTTTTTVRREVPETLPFSTETLNDSNLAVGTQVVAREGVAGRVTKVYEDTYTNGVKTGERLVEEIGRVAPINKVILIDTRPNQPATPTVTTERRSVSEVVPFETKRIEDANLELGKEVVIQEGQNGSLVKVYEDTLTNGVKTGERLVEVKNISQPVTKLIHVGTRPRTAITTQTRQVPETIPFETKRIDDDNLEVGKEVVLQEGQAGLLVKVYEDTYTNGVKTSERVVEVREVTLPVTKIIRVGRRVVGKVTTQTREVPEAVAFDTQRVEDPSLEVGKEVVTQEGKAGQVVKVYEDTYTDGVKTGERLIDVREVSQPVTKIVRFGSRPATTVTTKTREVPEVIAFDTQRVEDPSLEVGKEVIAQEGKVGQVVKVYEDTYTNGVKTGERLIDVREAELPVTRIILVGTKVVTPEVPTKPADPTTPVEPTKPADPTTPVEPTEPADPTTPVEPTKPADPTTPVEPTKPADPTTPVEPTKPADPTTPVEPTKPADPTTPVEPTKPADPTTPVEPTKPADPTTPVEPTELEAPTTSVKPTESERPAPKPTAPAPAAATPAAPAAASQESLPETGDASSALAALGAASLMASLGLVGLKKKD